LPPTLLYRAESDEAILKRMAFSFSIDNVVLEFALELTQTGKIRWANFVFLPRGIMTMRQIKLLFTTVFLILILTLTWSFTFFNNQPVKIQSSLTLAAPINPAKSRIQFDNFDEAEALLANEKNTIDVVNQFGPAVVAINVSVFDETQPSLSEFETDQLSPDFGELLPFIEEIPQENTGSGFLINFHGEDYLVTNYHVVQDSLISNTTDLKKSASITAVFSEQKNNDLPLKVVGANPSFDLALLTTLHPSEPFPPNSGLTITNSDAVQVGQKVIAIGNPFGLDSTVTTGIVSAVNRFVPTVGQINIPMIQTDASINPGNSGGPLLNSRGELIGINTAIFNPEGRSSAGLGFAVPSNLLIEALADLELGGLSDISNTRPTLGASVRTVNILPPGIRELLALPDGGIAVIEVKSGSPADKAGLRGSSHTVNEGPFEFPAGGDVITAVNGTPINNAEELSLMVTYEGKPGEQLEITFLRGGEEMHTILVLEIIN